MSNLEVGRRLSPTKEEEKRKYRQLVLDFCTTFNLDKRQAHGILVRFRGNCTDAHAYLSAWCIKMMDLYGVEDAVALEYVKTAKGDFTQAEAYIKLSSTMADSSSLSRRASSSPQKRRISHVLPVNDPDQDSADRIRSAKHRRRSYLH
jgi:hypothetical protein